MYILGYGGVGSFSMDWYLEILEYISPNFYLDFDVLKWGGVLHEKYDTTANITLKTVGFFVFP